MLELENMSDNSLRNTLRNITINYMDKNNITLETMDKQGPESNSNPSPATAATAAPPAPSPINLESLAIVDENTALNVMVSFLHMAQKRGAFNLQESAKVWECVQFFMKKH